MTGDVQGVTVLDCSHHSGGYLKGCEMPSCSELLSAWIDAYMPRDPALRVRLSVALTAYQEHCRRSALAAVPARAFHAALRARGDAFVKSNGRTVLAGTGLVHVLDAPRTTAPPPPVAAPIAPVDDEPAPTFEDALAAWIEARTVAGAGVSMRALQDALCGDEKAPAWLRTGAGARSVPALADACEAAGYSVQRTPVPRIVGRALA